jgi:hypothetical protein
VTITVMLVVVVPLVLSLVGVVPSSYAFTGGELRVLPNMVDLPAAPTIAFLVVTHVVVIATAHAFVARLRGEHREAERRLRMQAWQLAQLVPADARTTVVNPG